MSNPVPSHLVPGVEDLERGVLERDEKMRLYADLLIANAVPSKDAADVAKAITDGWLSPAGDVLRYDGEDVY